MHDYLHSASCVSRAVCVTVELSNCTVFARSNQPRLPFLFEYIMLSTSPFLSSSIHFIEFTNIRTLTLHSMQIRKRAAASRTAIVQHAEAPALPQSESRAQATSSGAVDASFQYYRQGYFDEIRWSHHFQ